MRSGAGAGEAEPGEGGVVLGEFDAGPQLMCRQAQRPGSLLGVLHQAPREPRPRAAPETAS